MNDQSDTPRTEMAEGQGLNPYFEGRFDGESDELCALRLTLVRERDEAQAEGVEQARLLGISGSREAALMAKVDAITRERDEARAIANDRDAMVDHRDRALTAMYQRVDVITQERDEARAEVERMRSALGFYSQPVRYDGPNQRPIPGDPYTAADSAYMNDVCRDGGEIAREALAATEAKP